MRAARTITALLAAGLVLGLAACGGDDDEQPPADAPAEVEATDRGELGSKPEVQVPDGPPPDELEAEDLIEGEGREAEEGDTVTVNYVGVSYETGEEFDASWDHGEPFTFTLGSGMVIEGWDQGVEGMSVGGRRQLVIPPELAYGELGSPPAIGPDETLVFVVDLLEVG